MEKEKQILAEKNIAIVGVSRNSKKYSSVLLKEFRDREYNVYAVNPLFTLNKETNQYPEINQIENIPATAIFTLKPDNAFMEMQKAHKAGVKNFWFVNGSSSKKAVDYCEENNLNYVSGKCPLLYLEPVKSIHKFHRMLVRLFGKY